MRKYLQQNLDQYYTDPTIAHNLLDQLFNFVPIDSFDYIVESSAGCGNFSNYLLELTANTEKTNIIALDIDPKHETIQKIDFLKLDPKTLNLNNPDRILVGFNPPYGVSSADANAFVKKSCEFANHIAMILPRSFLLQKNMKTIPLNFHPVLNIPIEGNPFVVNGEPYDKILKTVFVYFQKLDHPRILLQPVTPNGNWIFLKKSDEEQRNIADFKLQQNGSKSGRCVLSTDDDFVIKNKKSKIYTDFYIQVNPEFKNKLKDIQTKLNSYDYSFQNLTTWKSLGKDRVAIALNSVII